MLVAIEATGVCHSDLHVIEEDGWGHAFPVLLGHEGAGIVEAVGEQRDDRDAGRQSRHRLEDGLRDVCALQARESLASAGVRLRHPAVCTARTAPT